MSRRTWTILGLLALPLGGGRAGTPPPAPSVRPGAALLSTRAAAATRPNIVFVLTDDQDASIQEMHKLRSLVAEQGLSFSNSFVSDPLCCPSRATLLTGLYAHHHDVLSNKLPQGGFEKFKGAPEATTLATRLQAAGYRTALVGKYLNRYPGDARDADLAYVPPGWDFWAAFFSPDRTSGAYFDFFLNEQRDVGFHPRNEGEYVTDAMLVQARRFVDAMAQDRSRPFFLWITPNAPHSPPEPAPRHVGALGGLRAPRTGAFDEADMSDKPAYYQQLPRLSLRDLDRLDALYEARQETLLAVDDLVEGLLQRLSERGLLEDTYVFFSSDNGFLLGQHRFTNGKDAPYEESIRVPLVVRGPGVPRGSSLPHLVVNLDLPATFLELAGAPADASLEGRSLVPLLRAAPPAESQWRSDFLIEHWRDDDDGLPSYAGLRTREYAYVEYEGGERELYDLRSDPFEEQSLHATADPALLTRLSQRLAVLRNCRGAGCR